MCAPADGAAGATEAGGEAEGGRGVRRHAADGRALPQGRGREAGAAPPGPQGRRRPPPPTDGEDRRGGFTSHRMRQSLLALVYRPQALLFTCNAVQLQLVAFTEFQASNFERTSVLH